MLLVLLQVQVSMGGQGGMMLMYDETRRLHRNIIMDTEQPAAGRGGQGGAAEGLHGAQGREGGEGAGLRLCVDNGDLPQQQKRW